jgi:tetratricopeptide (TPR) repeat protein
MVAKPSIYWPQMRRPLAICAAWIALAGAAGAADPRWIRLASPHFEIYSSAGVATARDILRQFEQVRSFFFQVAGGHDPRNAVPLRIVAFGSAKEYNAVRINEFASAFYQSTTDHDFIVMGPGTAATSATAIHEYVHLVVRHSDLHFPPWLNEGIAELYSTIQQRGDKVLVGSLVPGRQMALARERWVPLATLVAVDQGSPYYNEKDKAGSLYNEGWALTHMLALRDDYRPKFGELMAAIHGGSDTAEAFRKVYGKSVGEVERDLREYLGGARFQGVLVPARLENFNEKLEAEPVAPFDVKLTLARIRNRPGRETETRPRFEELIAEGAKRPEPYAELGYLDWRAGRAKDAIPEFEKAYTLGARGSRFLWDYGRLAEREPAAAIPALRDLLEQEPDRMEVRLELAEVQLHARLPEDALRTLAPVRQVTKADAPRLFRTAALAEWQAGHADRARSAAEKYRNTAATDVDRAQADRLLASMDHREPAPPPPPRPSLEGTFERLDCAGKQPRFIVRTASGVRTFLIEDPERVAIVSDVGGTVELSCGPQPKPPHVTVEYDAGPAGVDGAVRVIHLRP